MGENTGNSISELQTALVCRTFGSRRSYLFPCMCTSSKSHATPLVRSWFIYTSLRDIFRLVKDSFLSEIVSKQQHRHAEIYHRGNYKLLTFDERPTLGP